jgi:putative Mg2+ transporter-C (MgtC) family protein
MQWVLENCHSFLSSPWAHVAITITSVLCGAIVGTEREKREKPAGLRTLALVCLGSAVFTMISFAFGTTTRDTGRVAAQIVTGIGFLGAGVILHGPIAVSGLTTAATIWATAAMGIVVGVGYLGAAIGLSFLIRAVLTGLYWWEHRYIAPPICSTVEVLIDPDHGKTQFHLRKLMEEHQVHTPVSPVAPESAERQRLRFSLKLSSRQRAEFLSEVARLPAVREMREVPGQGAS